MEMVKKIWLKNILFFALLFIAVWAVYGNVLDSPFILDDPRVIERNIKLRDLSNFFHFSEFFKLRPMVNLSFAVDYALAGMSLEMFHATNITIHIFNAILVFFFTMLIFRQAGSHLSENSSVHWYASLFAAGLFALHPIQSQAVIYITQRAALLAAFFYMASIMSYLAARRYQARNHKRLYPVLLFILCFIFALFAFLSKKNSASIPVALLMTEILLFKNSWEKWKKKIPLMTGLLLLFFIIFLWIGGAFNSGLDNFFHRLDSLTRETLKISRWEYLCTQFNVIVYYLRLIFFPKGLNIDHGFRFSESFWGGATPVAFLIILSILIFGVIVSRKYKILGFGLFWFFITLSVESSIIPIRDAMFEHRVYLPFLGICIIAAFLLVKLCLKKPLAVALVFVLIGGTCLIVTNERTKAWESDLTLWRDSVEKAPHSTRSWNNYGIALEKRGKDDLAAKMYEKAIEADPEYARPYCNLGKYYAGKKDFKKAEKLLKKSLALRNHLPEATNNLGVIYALQGKYKKALKYFNQSLKVDNNRASCHVNVGKMYFLLNRYDKALSHYLKAVKLKSDIKPIVYYEIAAVYARKNKPARSAEMLAEAAKRGFDVFNKFNRDSRFSGRRVEIIKALSRSKQ